MVRTSATATWFQTQEAYEFYASMPELFKPFAIGLMNVGRLKCVCVGYVTEEKNALKQMFTRRAIIIGGPCFADDCTDEEVTFLLRSLTHSLIHSFIHSPIYIETRNFNDYSRWKGAFAKAGFDYQPHLNFHVDCADKAAMDGKLSENRKRQIKKAIKSGIEISELSNDGMSRDNSLNEPHTLNDAEQEIKEWYDILLHLYKTRVKTPLFPLSFFIEFYRQRLGKYLLVKFDGKVIGGIMCPILEGRCIYEWFVCGMDTEYRNQNPSVMATYAAMEYGNACGLARFDFMGAGKPNEPYGVREFKEKFGGEMVEHGRFLHVAEPIMYKIGVLGVKMVKKFK